MKPLTPALALLTAIASFSTISRADSCAPLVADAINWINQSNGRTTYTVSFMMSAMKAPAKFTSYSVGGFSKYGSGLRATNVKAAFSDRTWCPELASGSLCLGYQPFDHRKQDVQTITLSNTGSLQVILNTWGNATYTVNMQCSNGFAYGVMAESNGNSMITLNLKKDSFEIPR